MKHEFKPGDQAIIKQCKTWPPAVGRCVELIVAVPSGEDVIHDGRLFRNTSGGVSWLISHPDGFPIHSNAFGLLKGMTDPVALFRERLLMPLRGDEDPDATLATERPSELVVA